MAVYGTPHSFAPAWCRFSSRFLSCHDAQSYVRSLHLNTLKEWQIWSKSSARPREIPSNPYRAYKKSGWRSWRHFLGTEFVRYEEASSLAKSLRMQSRKEWQVWSSSGARPRTIPSNPSFTYKHKGWTSWRAFLGTQFAPFTQAHALGLSSGFARHVEWREWSRSKWRPREIPSNPNIAYKDAGWQSWRHFLGTEFLPYDDAQSFAQRLQLKRAREWQMWCKSGARPTRIPSNPNVFYRNCGWKSWEHFLGVTEPVVNRSEWSFSFENGVYDVNVARAALVKMVYSALSHVDVEVVKVDEGGRAHLLIRHVGDRLWYGIQIKTTSYVDCRGRLQFNRRSDRNCEIFLFAYVNMQESAIRWWVAPAQLAPAAKNIQIYPNGKWRSRERTLETLAAQIINLTRSSNVKPLSESEWCIPKSPSRRTEYEHRITVIDKLFYPLGWHVDYPEVHNTVVDMIVSPPNGLPAIRIQSKTASGAQYLTAHLRKSGGGKSRKQPYSIKDPIDAFLINIVSKANLIGIFIFPIDVARKNGWLRGGDCSGKMSVTMYPPVVSCKCRAMQQDQLQWYLDLRGEVDQTRALAIFAKCEGTN